MTKHRHTSTGDDAEKPPDDDTPPERPAQPAPLPHPGKCSVPQCGSLHFQGEKVCVRCGGEVKPL